MQMYSVIHIYSIAYECVLLLAKCYGYFPHWQITFLMLVYQHVLTILTHSFNSLTVYLFTLSA